MTNTAPKNEQTKQIALKRLATLATIEHTPAVEATYSRGAFGTIWDDLDKDGQDERAEILIRFSRINVEFATTRERRVVSGRWFCKFTGDIFTDAGDLDIDHFVPLKNAWLSGADVWTEQRRERFANGFGIKSNSRSWLIPVSSSANRSKGARGPEEWLPPRKEFHIRYAAQWIMHKAYWKLSVTAKERAALEAILTGTKTTSSTSSVEGDVPISRMERIIASLDTFVGRKTRDGKPYVTDLRKHVNIPDITSTERDTAVRLSKSRSKPKKSTTIPVISSISRMERIVASLKTFKGKRTRDGKPYITELRRHSGISDISIAERDKAFYLEREAKEQETQPKPTPKPSVKRVVPNRIKRIMRSMNTLREYLGRKPSLIDLRRHSGIQDITKEELDNYYNS